MLDALSDSARLWLFAAEPAPAQAGADPAAMLADVQAFCGSWTSHGRPVRASADVLAGRVVAVAAQISDAEFNAGVSGCGIDAMQHAVEAAATRHGLTLAPALAVTFRDAAGAWQTLPRPAFRRFVADGVAGADTRVLDLTPATLGALRAVGVERRAGDTWHAAAFRLGSLAT